MPNILCKFLKQLIIIFVFLSFVENEEGHAAVKSKNIDSKQDSKPQENDWKYDDDVSKAIRTYDNKHEKWEGNQAATLKCQRLALKSYDVKIRALLDQKKYDVVKDAEQFSALEDKKNEAFSVCVKAFQTTSSSEKETAPERPEAQEKREWKNNDDVSVGIRAYDRAHNIWTDENQAILQCKQKAQSNYQTQKIAILDNEQFDPQEDAQALEDLKVRKEDTFSACEKAFKR